MRKVKENNEENGEGVLDLGFRWGEGIRYITWGGRGKE